jgi:hypothetical protein
MIAVRNSDNLLFLWEEVMQSNWNLRYPRWVIDDGEPELRVGEEFEWFAVSFWSDVPLVRSAESARSAVPIADGRYRVNAEVIYISPEPKQSAIIIDFGIKAICDGLSLLPHGCEQGDHVTGELDLLLPLCTVLHTHKLSQRWHVDGISADLTPFVLDSENRFYTRDSSRITYTDVASTNSVKARSYLLNCRNLTS